MHGANQEGRGWHFNFSFASSLARSPQNQMEASASRWEDPLSQFEGANAELSAEEDKRARQVFLVSKSEGCVDRSALVGLLRAMGLTPSFLEMRELHKTVMEEQLSFARFTDIYVAEKKAWDSHDEVVAQLASFDHNNDGTIDSNEMVSALTSIGDQMTTAECEQLTHLSDDKGRIRIVVLAKWLLTK